MRILVAGGAGYVGSALMPKLLERGYDVDVVDLFWFGNALPAEVRIINRDLFDLQVSDMKNYDQVIFLAGLSNDPMAEFSPSKNFIFNAAAPPISATSQNRPGFGATSTPAPVRSMVTRKTSSLMRTAPYPRRIRMEFPSSRASRRSCS